MKYTLKTIGALLLLFAFKMNAQRSNEEQPNIIWITCEDISPYISVFGDTVVHTPNIDALAEDGVKFTSTYTVAGVCSPSRAGIITGMHPIAIGAQHMRTRAVNAKVMPEGVPMYDAVLPAQVKAFPEYLRKEGYYTSNNEKEDYQFEEPVTVWDESSAAASYTNNKEGKPFFSVYNFFITHESQMMKYADSLFIDPDKVVGDIPSYYQDTPTVRKDLANMLTRIETMDAQVGQLIAQLKKDGLYENSYIFFFSDHGGNMPWMKREILERGTHIPFVVKYPKGKHAGEEVTDLISSIDFAPTVLSIAGIAPPKYMQGQAFIGEYASKSKRKYVYAARDRMDEKYDRVRAVRDANFRYIYNFYPNQPKYQDLVYRKGVPTMQEILKMREEGEITNPYLADWFKATKPVEELYNVTEDPDEVHNLANDPAYQDKLKELRSAYLNWIGRVGDLSYMSEKDMVLNYMWNGAKEVPQTQPVVIMETSQGIYLKEGTEGTSIGYRVLPKTNNETTETHEVKSWDYGVVFNLHKNGEQLEAPKSYTVYDGEFISLEKGETLEINAMRIGYKPYVTTFVQK